MAIALDTSVQNAGTSWSHTCTGSNLILFVWGITDSGDPTGCLCGSIQMTRISTTTGFLFVLANPPTGANTIALQGALGNNASISVSYTGADGVLDATDTTGNTQSTGTVTATPTVVASNCWLLGFAYDSGAQGFAITSTSTRRQEIAEPGHAGQERIAVADSNGTVGTGAQSITFNDAGASSNFFANGISIAPYRASILAISKVNMFSVNKIDKINKASINKVANLLK